MERRDSSARCAQSDTGPWPRGMGPRMREDNGRGEGAHEGRHVGEEECGGNGAQ